MIKKKQPQWITILTLVQLINHQFFSNMNYNVHSALVFNPMGFILQLDIIS